MKPALPVICLCFVLLQGCSQQAGNNAASNTATSTDTAAGKPAEYNQAPQSQKFYFDAKAAAEKNDLKGCYESLDKAIEAAKKEGNTNAAILCIETQAQVKLKEKKPDEAITVIETRVKEIDNPNMDMRTMARLEGLKALEGNIYGSVMAKPDKAEALYKTNLEAARQQKPVNHQRTAFWLKNYSEFCRVNKRDKESEAMSKESDAELQKDPSYAAAMKQKAGKPTPPPASAPELAIGKAASKGSSKNEQSGK